MRLAARVRPNLLEELIGPPDSLARSGNERERKRLGQRGGKERNEREGKGKGRGTGPQ